MNEKDAYFNDIFQANPEKQRQHILKIGFYFVDKGLTFIMIA